MENKDIKVTEPNDENKSVDWESEYKRLASDAQRLSGDYQRLAYINRALIYYGLQNERAATDR